MDRPAARAPGEAVLSEVIDALTEGLAVFDDAAVLIHTNESFRNLNPLLSDILYPGLAWPLLLHEAVQRSAIGAEARDRLEWMEMRLADGDRSVQPIEIEGPNDSYFEVAMRPTVTGGFVIAQRDITERRRLENNEREADILLRRVLEACPASVIMSRMADGEIIYRSPAAVELLGTGRQSRNYFANRDERADFITALLPNGRVDDMPVTALRPDGTSFPCLISARLIDYRGEDVIVSSTVDISKEVALRRTLAEQREQIFQAEKMSALGELLAGVAHELNNPLSVVVGHALMMREEATDGEVLRRIEKISDAAERCARIVKSFLAMARQQPMRLQPMDIRDPVGNAIDALRQGPSGLSAAVETDLPAALPQVRGDAHQLGQVFMNLIGNADQAIRDSGTGGRIRVTARHDVAAGMVDIRVADDGPGVPPGIRSRIFDPLFTTKEVGKGTGIGLAFSHRVVSGHSGQIALLPSAGQGAEFMIRLPVARAEGAGAAAETGSRETARTARLLVVDDEPEVAELIREILRKDGFAVDSAESAETALSMIRSQPYALVLTDLNMPGMGGRGFYERIMRELPHLAARVGFVTGDTMSPQARGFLDSVGRPCLEKPIAPGELRQLVGRMLGAAQDGGTGR